MREQQNFSLQQKCKFLLFFSYINKAKHSGSGKALTKTPEDPIELHEHVGSDRNHRNFIYSYIHSFIQAISIASLQVHANYIVKQHKLP